MEAGEFVSRGTALLKNLRRGLERLGTCTSGQDFVEYALMTAFIAVLAGAIFPTQLAPPVSTMFNRVSSALNAS